MRDTAARRGRGAGDEQRQTGAPHRPQNDTMPMTRIEPYRLPRATIRELMEGRPAGADDGGIPPEGVPGEDAQIGPTERRNQRRRRDARGCARYMPGAQRRSAAHTGQESSSNGDRGETGDGARVGRGEERG